MKDKVKKVFEFDLIEYTVKDIVFYWLAIATIISMTPDTVKFVVQYAKVGYNQAFCMTLLYEIGLFMFTLRKHYWVLVPMVLGSFLMQHLHGFVAPACTVEYFSKLILDISQPLAILGYSHEIGRQGFVSIKERIKGLREKEDKLRERIDNAHRRLKVGLEKEREGFKREREKGRKALEVERARLKSRADVLGYHEKWLETGKVSEGETSKTELVQKLLKAGISDKEWIKHAVGCQDPLISKVSKQLNMNLKD